MKNAVFWDVAPCRSCVNRTFYAEGCLSALMLHLRNHRKYFDEIWNSDDFNCDQCRSSIAIIDTECKSNFFSSLNTCL
jgi:hypothetical protein